MMNQLMVAKINEREKNRRNGRKNVKREGFHV